MQTNQNKIYELERRIKYLETSCRKINEELPKIRHEISLLKGESVIQENPYTVEQNDTKISIDNIMSNNEMTEAQQNTVVENVDVPQKQMKPLEKKKISAESFIGKNMMAVGASVLIFIALIMYATLILPALNDTIKMVSMYLVSMAFIVGGETILKKNQNNKWAVSLLGCGAGAIFISLFVTMIYFKFISEVQLYAALVIWAIYVGYLGYKKSILFHIIGQVGIVIAMAFSIPYAKTSAEVFFTTIILIAAEIPFVVASRRNKEFYNIASVSIGFTLSSLLLVCPHTERPYPQDFIQVIILTLLTVSIILLNYIQSKRVNNNSKSVFYVIQTLFSTFAVMGMVSLISKPADYEAFDIREYGGSYLAIAVALLAICAIHHGSKGIKELRVITQSFLLFIMSISIYASDEASYLCLLGMFIICIFNYYGALKDYTSYRIYASAMFAIQLLFSFKSKGFIDVFLLIIGILVLATPTVLKYINKAKENDAITNTNYLIIVYAFINLCNHPAFGLSESKNLEIIMHIITFFGLWVIQYFVKKHKLVMTGGAEVLPKIVNVLIMMAGPNSMIDDINDCNIALFKVVIQVLYTIILVGIYSIYVSEIIKKYKAGGAYVGIKYTYLSLCILTALGAGKTIFSLVCLVISIISIMLGFYKGIKSLRLYGLVLAIISIFKLLMVDISYDNTASRAFSFLLSGILCFVISLIYNKIDGKFKSENNINEEISDENNAEGIHANNENIPK